MRKIARVIAVGTMAVPFLAGLTGAAFADTAGYHQEQQFAGPTGAAASSILSEVGTGVGGAGNGACFEAVNLAAGPNGAALSEVKSHVFNGDDGTAGAGYEQTMIAAGPAGAGVQSVGSHVFTG
ncbi:hypothetical protein [Kitasatospora fiedleri]|uniref:hypothetical protein n=1 Tax=Kitasatospora fiedleri TaxID=2991545 RepID=UPI000C2C1C28|nr:hypothetical protein [Kitasatospora fiedleri]